MNTGEKWEGDKNMKAKLEQNVKEMIIPTLIGGFCTTRVIQ